MQFEELADGVRERSVKRQLLEIRSLKMTCLE